MSNRPAKEFLFTPWGKMVKKRLVEKGLQQKDLVTMLNEAGYSVSKQIVNQMLHGLTVNARKAEIGTINKILDIEE